MKRRKTLTRGDIGDGRAGLHRLEQKRGKRATKATLERKSFAPKTAPQSVAGVLLGQAIEHVTDEMHIAFRVGIVGGPDRLTKKQRAEFAKAVLALAVVGSAYLDSLSALEAKLWP